MPYNISSNKKSCGTGYVYSITVLCLLIIFFSCSHVRSSKKPDIETTINSYSRELKNPPILVRKISSDLEMFRMVEISGDAYDLGFVLGKTAIAYGYSFPECSRQMQPICEKIIAMYSEIYPVYLDQMEGFASAYGRDLTDLDLTIMENSFYSKMGIDSYELQSSIHSGFTMCSIAAAISPDSSVLIGRNLDTFNITGFLVRSELKGTYKTLNTSGEAYHHFAVDGINEKGLFVGEMSITDERYRNNLSQKYPSEPSVYSIHMIRILLDTCADVDEAVALFRKVPVWFTYDLWHYFITDSKGNVCIVEWDETGTIRFIRRVPPIVSTNTAFIEGEKSLQLCPRFRIAKKLLSSETISSHNDMYGIMKSISYRHDNGFLKSLVQDDEELKMMKYLKTVWTSTYDLNTLSMQIRFWENEFKDIVLDL